MTEKAAVRYLGYTSLTDGGRGFDFSIGPVGERENLVSIQVSADLFQGPDRIFVQEAPGICYETLRNRIENYAAIPDHTIRLNSFDVAQHRKSSTKPAGRRY
jgi:hypothetical protein